MSSSATTVPAPYQAPARDPRVSESLGKRRKRANMIVQTLCVTATAIGLILLAMILYSLLWRGFGGLSLTVFTTITKSPGSNGGLLNAIVGSLIQTALGAAIG